MPGRTARLSGIWKMTDVLSICGDWGVVRPRKHGVLRMGEGMRVCIFVCRCRSMKR